MHDVRPAIDSLSRFADCLGKNLLLIEALPLPAVIKLNKMRQGTARAEKLPLGNVQLGCERLGHGKSLFNNRKN
jgi:hypothetical protein